jgi:putative PIG3 family NAD(P)H quinone oxidoreductase
MTAGTMQGVVITQPGGPEVLAVRELERPVPRASEILVRVRATALNRADLLQRQGRYPAPPGAAADIPGLEFAGEVEALGDDARAWRVGDRVFGITGGGGHAQYVTIHEQAVARVPRSMPWEEAGAVPEAFITAHDALVMQAGVREDERVLVHAVGSGVGLASIQLVRAWKATPFGTARTGDKIERAREYGLEDGVVVGSDIEEIVRAAERWSAGKGMDVTLDLVGGPYLEASVRASALKARIMLIGTVAGRSATVSLGVVLSKRITIRGTVLRARSVEEKIAATRAFSDEVLPLLERGTVRPVIDSVFDLEQIRDAHERLEGNQTFGKVVLRVP